MVLAVTSAVVGFLLYQSYERENRLKTELHYARNDCDNAYRKSQLLAVEFQTAQSSTQDLGRTVRSAERDVERLSSELSARDAQLDGCHRAEQQLRPKLERAKSVLNSGLRSLSSILSELAGRSRTSHLLMRADERMAIEHNDLAHRFSAAVQRCDELHDTVNSVIDLLRR